MRKTREQLEAMTTDELKGEWDEACAAHRKLQPEHTEILMRGRFKEGEPVKYTTEEELEISEQYGKAVKYLRLVGEVMKSRM